MLLEQVQQFYSLTRCLRILNQRRPVLCVLREHWWGFLFNYSRQQRALASQENRVLAEKTFIYLCYSNKNLSFNETITQLSAASSCLCEAFF